MIAEKVANLRSGGPGGTLTLSLDKVNQPDRKTRKQAAEEKVANLRHGSQDRFSKSSLDNLDQPGGTLSKDEVPNPDRKTRRQAVETGAESSLDNSATEPDRKNSTSWSHPWITPPNPTARHASKRRRKPAARAG